ncbi:MAG: glycogen debranching protein [Bacteroidota bacterium]
MLLQRFPLWLISFILLLFQCQTSPEITNLLATMADTESIPGRMEYLNSPFVTAGDRTYMVGHQNGQFPDLGWHVAGEMGGIWDHPIKLMDGFTASITSDGQSFCLAEADTFINYPFANRHIYSSTPANLRVERFQFVPDGKEAVVVQYTFINQSEEAQTIELDFTGYADLRPVWLGERTNMQDTTDVATWNEALDGWVAKDSLNEWYTLFGSSVTSRSHTLQESEHCQYEPKGQGVAASIRYSLKIPAQGEVHLPITIAGSYQSQAAAEATYTEVQQRAEQLLQAKKERYRAIAEKSKLTILDKDLEQAFRWVKYNTDWLIRDVPETGRGISAGIPDYPWWFGVDSEYTLQGALAVGQVDLVYSTIDLLHHISEETNGNGRIVHEVSTNGVVFNPGNINETPQFATLIWRVFEWTGDQNFLEKYYPTVQKGLEWLMRERDADGNLLPDGFGMMEIHGLDSEMIDVAVYTQQAFADAAKMAQVLGDESSAQKYTQTAEQLHEKINTDFWVAEANSYADFIGTTEQALHLIDDAIIRADTLNKPWAVEELKGTKARIANYSPQQKQGFVMHHNWVVNTPMEMGIADSAKAQAALKTGGQFVNPFGVFVTGIDRDETAGQDAGSFTLNKKVFSYTGAVMTLPTGVQAIAENNYGNPDTALDYLQRMTRTFGFALPGSIYEVSPDYGMMTQAWNLYSYAIPIVQQFFGVRPRTYEQTVRIQPQMPSSWPQAQLENVIIGDNQLNISYTQQEEGLQFQVGQSQDWSLEFAFPDGKYTQWRLNGEEVIPQIEDGLAIVATNENKITIEVK